MDRFESTHKIIYVVSCVYNELHRNIGDHRQTPSKIPLIVGDSLLTLLVCLMAIADLIKTREESSRVFFT